MKFRSHNTMMIMMYRFSLLELLLAIITVTFTAANDFNPYVINGGLVSAVAGTDFVVVATDTRLSEGYNIIGRQHVSSRLWSPFHNNGVSIIPTGSSPPTQHRLDAVDEADNDTNGVLVSHQTTTQTVWIASAGCQADCEGLKRQFQSQVRATWGTTTPAAADATALALSHELYARRGFPYYAFCLVSGIDEQHHGSVYAYDAIGSYEKVAVASAGTGRDMLQPILDRMFVEEEDTKKITNCPDPETAVQKLIQAYRAVAEREIAVGDGIVLVSTRRRADGTCETKVWSSPLKSH